LCNKAEKCGFCGGRMQKELAPACIGIDGTNISIIEFVLNLVPYSRRPTIKNKKAGDSFEIKYLT
jgi:Fe-S-cluster-containing dehydrogenase component